MASKSTDTFTFCASSKSLIKSSAIAENPWVPSCDYWIRWKEILIENGMVCSANAITRHLCRHCDSMMANDRKLNRPWTSEERAVYKPDEMDRWTEKINDRLKEEFGRWPAVYDSKPELKENIFE